MEFVDGVLKLESFLTVTLGIVVLFVGKRVNQAVGFLREFSIPEPVTGGILFSLGFLVIHLLGVDVDFSMGARDVLLVYFFTTIGINASLKDLIAGGKPLVILLAITIGYMAVQNLTGIGIARLFGMSTAEGLLGGSVALIGGHGTAIAWAPKLADEPYLVANAMEMGIASATFGLILASLMGGPVAKFLISRHKLEGQRQTESFDVTAEDTTRDQKAITYFDFLDALLALHVCIIVGLILHGLIGRAGLDLPEFVPCLFAGVLLTNLRPKRLKRLTGTEWPSRKPSIALIADVSLGTFLAMSLMSMKLWDLIDLAGPLFAILAAQFTVAMLVTVFVVFPAMGRTYDAAVVCAGFGGISLGSTPTAMANMSAVAQRYGSSHLAFIIVPLVCAFFIDLANALMIPFFLQNL